MRYEQTSHPSVYEINTRPWLAELASAAGRPLTLADVSEATLVELAALGFDYVWLMGVWEASPLAAAVARAHAGVRASCAQALSDLTEADIVASPYAIFRYRVDPSLGGPDALITLRQRLARLGIGVILDFVPNHVALDHPWVSQRPELFVGRPLGAPDDAASGIPVGDRLIAFGRDPFFPPWSDTAQLDHRKSELRAALIAELITISRQCDGVRCDMAMLVLDDVFESTWHEWPLTSASSTGEFWSEAILSVRAERPDFLFLAEAYWRSERRLQALGFDYTYDKELYDHLVIGDAHAISGHLDADGTQHHRCAHFLENHDERRAAATIPFDRHLAAATVALTLPGLRLLHDGQLDGFHRRVPVQLRRRPTEPADRQLRQFYERLLRDLARPPFRRGVWQKLLARSTGDERFRQVLVWNWDGGRFGRRLIAVNFGEAPTWCRVTLPFVGLAGRQVNLIDRLSDERYSRDGDELTDPSRGLTLGLRPWQAQIFEIR